MPIYEYLCEKCNHEFEREQRISDPPVRTCPKCRSRKVTKLISRTSFVLKGGGWYSDLYSSAKAKGESDSAPAESSGGSSEAAKPETAKSETSKSEAPKTQDKPPKPGGDKPKSKSGSSKKSAA